MAKENKDIKCRNPWSYISIQKSEHRTHPSCHSSPKFPFVKHASLPQDSSDLSLRPLQQFSRGTADGQLASLLDLGLEDDLVAFLPHLSHERLPRVYGSSKADLYVLVRTELLVHGLAGDAHEAQAVKNWYLEAAHLGKLRVDMERAVVC